MAKGGVILGGWTHRRGDVGGARAVSADVANARPRIAWGFRPPHRGRVDQVRIAGERVYVATIGPSDPLAVGWEHATLYSLDADSGKVLAERALPDPVPVAALIIDGDVVHVLATRQGEPVFWYALDAYDLRPKHRRPLLLDVGSIDRGARWDVLDAWASADGGVWLELDSVTLGKRAYGFALEDRVTLVPELYGETSAEFVMPRDACCVGQTLYAPRAGVWDEAGSATPPSLWQLDPEAQERTPADEPWARAALTGPRSHAHALAAEGVVSALAVAEDPTREGRVMLQAMIVDRASGVVRAQSEISRFGVKGAGGEAARLARRPNGEILFQMLAADGSPASDLWRAGRDGELSAIPLPNPKLVLDAALGDAMLGHYESRGGRVVVSAIEIDREGRLLGRRAATLWTIETPDLGGATTIYAGAGHVLARGVEAVASIRV
jgi:hypothetical protein